MIATHHVSISLHACRGQNAGNVLEFIDYTEHLNSNYQKYGSTHNMLVGGGINEDITVLNSDRRNKVFRNFLLDNELNYSDLGRAFLNTEDVEVSKIDFFLYSNCMADLIVGFQKLDSCRASLSNHYPLDCTLKCNYSYETSAASMDMKTIGRIRKLTRRKLVGT